MSSRFFLIIFFIIPIMSLISVEADNQEEKSGTVTLDIENNWVFTVRSDRIKSQSAITLDWTTNGSNTGWISCSKDNEIAGTANSTYPGSLSLIASDSSCSITVFRVYKPTNNITIFIVNYNYLWEIEDKTSNRRLNAPFIVGLIVTVVVLSKTKYFEIK